jgi:hypothetical protein
MEMTVNTLANDRFENLRERAMDALRRGEHVSSVLSAEERLELRQGTDARIQAAEEKNAQLRIQLEAMKEANRKRMEEIQRLIDAQAQREHWLTMPV